VHQPCQAVAGDDGKKDGSHGVGLDRARDSASALVIIALRLRPTITSLVQVAFACPDRITSETRGSVREIAGGTRRSRPAPEFLPPRSGIFGLGSRCDALRAGRRPRGRIARRKAVIDGVVDEALLHLLKLAPGLDRSLLIDLLVGHEGLRRVWVSGAAERPPPSADPDVSAHSADGRREARSSEGS